MAFTPKLLQQGASGGGPKNYIEDVFSTWLYTGNGTSQTITNGIDLSTKGGLAWIKSRNTTTDNVLYTTNLGISGHLYTNGTSGFDSSPEFTSFNTTGFSVSNDALYAQINVSTTTYASWSFREQAKFFDVVTYTGTGSNTTIAHNLGSVPGCIMIKRRNAGGAWAVYHRSLANTEYLVLNTTAAKATGATRWNSTTPTSTEFSLGTDATVNASGGTYVAYIFAHDAGGFGLTGTDNVVSCGSYTGNAGTQSITLGYEPQWIMVKKSSGVGNWHMFDIMRGMPSAYANNQDLLANTSDAETGGFRFYPTATGFQLLTETDGEVNASGQTYIYMAIRRGPMKVPTVGTSVFTPALGRASPNPNYVSGFPVDLGISEYRVNGSNSTGSRLQGSNIMDTASTGAEASDGSTIWDFMDGYYTGGRTTDFVSWMFRRAPGFFDEVCYTGDGTADSRTFTHNLGVTPQLIIVKRRSSTSDWVVMFNTDHAVLLNSTNADTGYIGATGNYANGILIGTNSTTLTQYSGASGNSACNDSGSTYVAYLFATCAGVSKVGSYTGTATTLQIDCGFTGGARFVLIKRTDSTGAWYVWDTARGIVSGNDPYLLLNSTAAEVTNTDYIDSYSPGFELSSTAPAAINNSGGSYIFLAIA